jgi:hypothetical protein
MSAGGFRAEQFDDYDGLAQIVAKLARASEGIGDDRIPENPDASAT